MTRLKYHLPDDFVFGVEMEFTDLKLNELLAELPNHTKHFRDGIKTKEWIDGDVDDYKQWQLTCDPSVTDIDDDGEDAGGEIISPVLDVCAASWSEVRKMTKILTASGAYFGIDTGYHIHADLNDVNRLILMAIWFRMSADIYAYLYHDRQDSRFLRTLIPLNRTGREMTTAAQIIALLINNDMRDILETKYLDLHMYEENNTSIAEFRVAGMTDDHDQISGWTKAVLQMINEAYTYRDLFDFIEQDRQYTFTAVNSRAPLKLQMKKAETAALYLY